MENGINFTEELFNNLGTMNSSIEKLMIQFIHVLKSTNVSENVKQSVRDAIVDIGKELNSFYLSINQEKITKYDVREIEKKIIEKNEELKKEIDRLMENVNKRKEVIIDNKMKFSIEDVITQLGNVKFTNEYAITKDKIDNLFAVKKFIVNMYNDQFTASIAKEKKTDIDLYTLKQKAFLDTLRNAITNNPEYFYKSVELIKKLINSGKKVVISGDEKQRDVIQVKLIEDSCIEYEYENDGIVLKSRLSKNINEVNCSYNINGMIGKGVSEVLYSISLTTIDKKYEQIEHMLGFDYLWAYYEQAYMEYHNKKVDASKRNEDINKNIIDKALDDLLFK
jgi:hypothetical protein